jgi:hypothetical protein
MSVKGDQDRFDCLTEGSEDTPQGRALFKEEAAGQPDDDPDMAAAAPEPDDDRFDVESALGDGLDAQLDATRIYLSEIGFSPLLSAEEEVRYARLAQQGDLAARQRMIESNLRLVVKIARRYINRGLPLLDLIEEGNLGLIHSVGKFDPELGYRFSTYATWWDSPDHRTGLDESEPHYPVAHSCHQGNQCLPPCGPTAQPAAQSRGHSGGNRRACGPASG